MKLTDDKIHEIGMKCLDVSYKTHQGIIENRAVSIQKAIIEYLKGADVPFSVYGKERYGDKDGKKISDRVRQYGRKPRMFVTIGSCDGSDNSVCEGSGPVGSVVSIFYPVPEFMRISDVAFGGAVNLRDGRTVHAYRDEGCKIIENGDERYLDVIKELRPDSLCYYDGRFRENLETLNRLEIIMIKEGVGNKNLPTAKGRMDVNSAVGWYKAVCDGKQNVAAYVNVHGMTPEELAPCYCMVKEAGGVFIDPYTFEDVGLKIFCPEQQYSVIAACNGDVAYYIDQAFHEWLKDPTDDMYHYA